MLPRTDVCVTTAHVPYSILANTHLMNTTIHEPRVPHATNMIHATPVPSRRGRRSTIPPDIREQTRRLKKQNMERRRRACISDKMNALHNLALSLVGVDPQESPKVEKADILSICHSVFEGIAKIAQDDPELKFRLHKLRNCLREPSTTTTNQSTTAHLIDETSRSSTHSDDSSSRTNSPWHPVPLTPGLRHQPMDHDNKENYVPTSISQCKTMSPQLDTSAFLNRPTDPWHSTPVTPKHMYSRQSSDSGFQSFPDETKLMSPLMPFNYPHPRQSSGPSPMATRSQSGQYRGSGQDHVFPKPSLPKYQTSCPTRSAFTPIRQSKLSPVPLLRSAQPMSAQLEKLQPPATSSSSSSFSSPSPSLSTQSQATPTMWRPYLD